MAFINIAPRTEQYYQYNNHSIPLRVVLDDIEVTPDISIDVNELSTGQKQFINGSSDGDSFKIKVVVHQNDTYKKEWVEETSSFEGALIVRKQHIDNANLIEGLDSWIRNMVVITVIADDAVDIPNGEYIITKNESRSQNRKSGYSIWELEFTRYTGVLTLGFKVNNKYVTKAINKYNANKAATAKKNKTKAKKASTSSNKLSKCNVSQLKYSKTKKVVACVKTLQQYLNKKLGCNLKVDGWYGDSTMKAVKQFQNKYKKKYNLTANGKMNAKTLDAMCKV